jgi:DNA polymerase-3 subunit epsilon
MTKWADGPLVAFDLETTGVDPEVARIVTASVIDIQPGQKPVAYEYVAVPEIDIPAAATAVHGISTEWAREHGIPAVQVIANVVNLLARAGETGTPVVIYNAPYDLTVLDRECRRRDLPTLTDADGWPVRVIDPLVLDRALDPYRKGSRTRELTYVAREVYGVPLSDADAHGSTADALAAARVAWKIAHHYPGCGQLTLDELQGKQLEWHRLWAWHFAKFLWLQQGGTPEVDPSWPIRPCGDPQAALMPAPAPPLNRAGLL